MRNKKSLKLALLAFVIIFITGTAFAATNGILTFGGTVRINSVVQPAHARLEASNTIWGAGPGVRVSLAESHHAQSSLGFNVNIDVYDFRVTEADISFRDMVNIQQTITNVGTAPARLTSFTYDFDDDMPNFTASILDYDWFFNSGYLPNNSDQAIDIICWDGTPMTLQPGESVTVIFRTSDFRLWDYFSRSGVPTTNREYEYAFFVYYVTASN